MRKFMAGFLWVSAVGPIMAAVIWLTPFMLAAPAEPVTQETFREMVEQSDLPTLVFVCSDKRGACKLQIFGLRRVSGKFRGRVRFVSVDADSQEALAADLRNAARFCAVNQMPYFLFYKNGALVKAEVGLMDDGELKRFIEEGLSFTLDP